MYLAFVDESGDPGLQAINPEYPMFALAAVICLEREYATRIEPQVRQFNRSSIPDADVKLNSRAIAKQRGPFAALIARENRRRFSQSLSDLLVALPVVVAAACLNKRMHTAQYPGVAAPVGGSPARAGNRASTAYDFTLPFLMERLVYLMAARHDSVAVTIQSHGRREDAKLRAVWDRHLAGGSYYHAPTEFASRLAKLEFRPALDASAGLQLADLAANACGRFVLDPEQPNSVFAALSPKVYQGKFTEPDRFGLKVIP